MSTVAVIGAGPIGGAIAHTLACRAGVHDVRLIDTRGDVAAGKALDIRQAGPIGGSDTRVTGSDDILAAVGAAVIILADDSVEGDRPGDAGQALIRRLMRAGSTAPIVCAGPGQTSLIEQAVHEEGIAHDRIIGAVGEALVGTVRMMTAREADRAGADVRVAVCGRPPRCTIAWSSATIGATTVVDRVPAHRLRAISQQLATHWPPGPQVVASATATIVRGLIEGSRRDTCGVVVLNGEFNERGTACVMPLALGQHRILQRIVPSLAAQELTDVLNSLARR